MNLFYFIFPIFRKKEGCSDCWGEVDSRNTKEKIIDYFRNDRKLPKDKDSVKEVNKNE